MKKIISLLLMLLLAVGSSVSLYASEFVVSDYINPFTGVAYTEDSFYGNGTIIIILSHPASIIWREYTVEDFPELELESVYTHEPMADEEGRKNNPEYRGFVDITLKDKSNKAVIEAIDILYERHYEIIRGDIYMALPETKSFHEVIEPEYPLIDSIDQKGSGDVNCDNRLNLADASSMLKYIAGWDMNIFVNYYADVNDDGSINLSDVTAILQKIARWDEDNICLKKPTDEFIRQIETELEAYHADQDGHYPGINYAVEIYRYYGTYNDAVVIYYEGGGIQYSQAFWVDYVAGYEFYYGDGNCIMLWKDGILYNMNQAYEESVLTKDQVAEIAELHEGGGYIGY